MGENKGEVAKDLDSVILEAEKSLEELVEKEASFFEEMRSTEAKAKVAEGLKVTKFGNHYRSFAAV